MAGAAAGLRRAVHGRARRLDRQRRAPSVQNDLHFSTSGLQWVVNAYTLAFAGFLLLGGRAADLFGRRRVFLIGLGLFTLASMAGGLAEDQAMLVTARALQGLGAAVLAPATLTILTTSFSEGPARARPWAFGAPWPRRGPLRALSSAAP